MSKVAIEGNASGTGTLTIAAPNTNSNFTLTIPDATTTIVGTDATQTLTNKSIVATQLTGTVAAARLPAGSVLQVVSTFKSDTFSTGSASFVDITGMSVTITPTSATSKILVLINLTVGPGAANFAPVNLVRNGTNIAQPTTSSTHQATLNNYNGEGAGYIGGSGQPQYALSFLDSPATTSTLTYKLQMLTTSSGVTAFVNTRPLAQNGTCTSTITVMEIAA